MMLLTASGTGSLASCFLVSPQGMGLGLRGWQALPGCCCWSETTSHPCVPGSQILTTHRFTGSL